MAWSDGWPAAEDFGDVFALCGECAGAISPLRVVAEEVAVPLHRGAATGGVDNDRVDVGSFEEGDQISSHLGGLVFEAGVDHESSAAGLAGWSDDLEAFCGEDTRCGCVDVREEDLLDAASEHTNAT